MSEAVEIKSKETAKLHWSTILLGLVVAAIFLFAIFSYQVQENEKAVVMTFGKITSVTDPGLHFRMPTPLQTIVRYDVRSRCFDGNIGKFEETMTHDRKNIIVGVYIIYNIDDPALFHSRAGSVAFAEDKLSSIMRTAKNDIIGKYTFDELINTDPKKMHIADAEKQMLAEIAPQAQANYGIKVISAGLRSIGVPEKTSKAIAERMVEERKAAATKYRSDGKTEAMAIKTKANQEKAFILADAEAEAKRIRAEGDAEAATHYAAFSANPDLAVFLRKIESLKRILSSKATLVLDTDSAPFDIMGKGGASAKDSKPVEPRPGK